MIPTRRSQPYRRLPDRAPSGVLSAMLAGKPKGMANPMDVQRASRRRGAALQRALARRAAQ